MPSERIATAQSSLKEVMRVGEEVRRAYDTGEGAEQAGWQFGGPQLSDDELVELMLHDRPGFLRYLQREWGGRPLPLEAKQRRLDWLARKAKERGVTLDDAYLAWIREGIRQRSL